MQDQKLSSSPTQTANTQVSKVFPLLNPHLGVPIHPNPLYNPNQYFNPLVKLITFVHASSVVVGPFYIILQLSH